METYTSPSGNRYKIEVGNHYGFEQWDIYDEGRWVQFALSEDGVAKSVRHYEQPGFDGWYSSSYD